MSTIALLPGASASASTTDIRIGNEAAEIWLSADGSIRRTSNGRTYEIREARWPGPLIEKLLLAAPAISFVEKKLRAEADVQSGGGSAVAPTRYPLSGLAAEASLKTLADRCEQSK